MAKVKDRNEYMTKGDRLSMAGLPRSHENCLEKTGVMRPGKTAQDRVRKRKNYPE